MTIDEFIAWENAQPDKHEFLRGDIFAMVGARRVHVAISLNVASLLKSHLRGGPCRAFMADMKLAIQAADATFFAPMSWSLATRATWLPTRRWHIPR